MRAAVLAVVERKFGSQGVFRGAISESGFRETQAVASAAHAVDDATVEATRRAADSLRRGSTLVE